MAARKRKPESLPLLLISPAEPATMRRAIDRAVAGQPVSVKYTAMPERYGVDFAWTDPEMRWHGIQRKAISDFVASVLDGRLAKEIGQMRAHVEIPRIVIEGFVRWSRDDTLVWDGWGRQVSKRQWNGMLFGLGAEGVQVLFAKDHDGTAELVVHAMLWTHKGEHGSLLSPPKTAARDAWGTAGNRDFQLALLQQIPGMGRKRATAMLDALGGLPWAWTCTVEDLAKIDGIGPDTARKMWQVLHNTQEEAR